MDNINKLLMHRKNNQNIIAKIKKELEQKTRLYKYRYINK